MTCTCSTRRGACSRCAVRKESPAHPACRPSAGSTCRDPRRQSRSRGTAPPVRKTTPFPFPTVEWPASDPLVTGVGGTYLCTDPTNTSTRTVDSVSPPVNCQSHPGDAEVGWIASGGGFSHVFAKPSYQGILPAGSTAIGAMRGVSDIGLQSNSRTGAPVSLTPLP